MDAQLSRSISDPPEQLRREKVNSFLNSYQKSFLIKDPDQVVRAPPEYGFGLSTSLLPPSG